MFIYTENTLKFAETLKTSIYSLKRTKNTKTHFSIFKKLKTHI